MCKEINQCRSHDRSQNGAQRGDSHGKGNVTAGKIGHHIGGCAAGAAADKNDADGNVGRKIKDQAKQPSQNRHDCELTQGTDGNCHRTAEDFGEIAGLKCQADAEHNDAEQRRNIRSKKLKRIRRDICKTGKNKNPQGKCFAKELTNRCKERHFNFLVLRQNFL